MRGLRFHALLITIAVALPATLRAQATQNLKERVANEAQIKAGKAQLSRDQEEIREFAAILAKMSSAKDAGAVDAYGRLYAQLRGAMKREVDQAKRKSAQSLRETGQSRREAHVERQEARASGSVRDHLQAAGDRRDLRDDRGDFRSSVWRAKRMSLIMNRAAALESDVYKGSNAAMVRCQRMMGEFLELIRADLRATAAELGEDVRERREDRRERRSDRNSKR